MGKLLQFFRSRQFSEEQQIGCFFKTKPFFLHKPPYQLGHIITAIQQLPIAGHLIAFLIGLISLNMRNVRQPSQHASTIFIPKSFFDTVFIV